MTKGIACVVVVVVVVMEKKSSARSLVVVSVTTATGRSFSFDVCESVGKKSHKDDDDDDAQQQRCCCSGRDKTGSLHGRLVQKPQGRKKEGLGTNAYCSYEFVLEGK